MIITQSIWYSSQWNRCKKYIFSQHQDDGLSKGALHIKDYVTKYYKDLFGPPEKSQFSLAVLSRDVIPRDVVDSPLDVIFFAAAPSRPPMHD